MSALWTGQTRAQEESPPPVAEGAGGSAEPATESDNAAPVGTAEASAESGHTGAIAPAPVGKKPESAGSYAVRLRDLEQRISELKEQIFRSKVRLSLLAETVLEGVVAGSQAAIVHKNQMSSSYRLVRVTYALDGAPIFNRADESGSLSESEDFQVYFGSIVPGEHTLTVNLEYQGHGYGVFSYLKGYRFKVRSTHSFTAPEGRALSLKVVGYEKGGPTAPLEERPAIRYIERVENKMSQAPVTASGKSE